MSKKLLIALILIALTVLVLVLNASGSVKLSLGFANFSLSRAIAYFCFTAIGVVIGVLLK